jgi:hypothetical protein
LKTLYDKNLTRKDIVEMAKEEIDYILGNDQGGMYDSNTDTVKFAVNKGKFKTKATLHCKNPITGELQPIKTVYHGGDTRLKYNSYIHRIILLHKLFEKDAPDIYLNVPERGE